MVNYIFNTEHISKSRLDKKIIFIMNENVKGFPTKRENETWLL